MFLVAGAVACSDSTPPQTNVPSGSYNLASVDGNTLPIVVYRAPFGGIQELVSGHIEFRTRGHLLDIRSFRTTPAGGPPGPMQVDTTSFAHETDGNRVLIRHPAPYEPDSYTDTATIAENTLVVGARPRRSFHDPQLVVGGRMLYTRAP